MAEILNLRLEEEAFLELQLHSTLTKQLQDVVNVVKVRVHVLGEDDDVVDIDEAHAPADAGQDDVKCTLEGGRGIAEPERHAGVPVTTHVRGEGSRLDVLRGNRDLPVTPEGIQGC